MSDFKAFVTACADMGPNAVGIDYVLETALSHIRTMQSLPTSCPEEVDQISRSVVPR